jgi:3'(2'), 5'-bisphosphate nucleotidase
VNETLQKMVRIAAEAAIEIMKVYETPFSVEFKAPDDPVTRADRIANELICERLREAFPHVPIVAEESPAEEWGDFRTSERVFFVDPVDGTREFVAKNGQFVVMIGLLEGDSPSHGVLYAPAQKKIWAGAVGEGAICRESGGAETRLPQLEHRPMAQARILSSRSHRTRLNQKILDRLAPAEIIPVGSTGLKVAAVSDGSADIYLAPEFAGCLWDSCAPEALVRSVGGVFTDAKGIALNYRAATVENSSGAVAASTSLHHQVIDQLRNLIPDDGPEPNN